MSCANAKSSIQIVCAAFAADEKSKSITIPPKGANKMSIEIGEFSEKTALPNTVSIGKDGKKVRTYKDKVWANPRTVSATRKKAKAKATPTK